MENQASTTPSIIINRHSNTSAWTVTSVSVATANWFSGTVATATTTPAITIIAWAITPTSVNKVTITAPATSSTLTVADGKTLTASDTTTLATNSITLWGGEVITFSATNAVSLLTTGSTSVTLPTSWTLLWSTRTINSQSGTTYTAVLGDAINTIVEFTSWSAVTFTIDTNANVAFPVGSQIDFSQQWAWKVTVAAAGGVTINSLGSNKALAGQYVAWTLIKEATNTWSLFGNLIA